MEMKNIVILHNIRSALNVGAIMRTAEGFSAEAVVFSGYTPRVHDTSLLPHLREKLDAQIHKTALGAEEMMELENSSDVLATLAELKKQGWRLVGLENNISDERLISLRDGARIRELGEKRVLVLGEEVNGIPEALFPALDVFVEIPMKGRKESFNVSVATGVALWELTR